MKKLIFVAICEIVYITITFVIQKKHIKRNGQMDIIGGYGTILFAMFTLLHMLNTQFVTVKQYSILVFAFLFLQGIKVVVLEIEARNYHNET